MIFTNNYAFLIYIIDVIMIRLHIAECLLLYNNTFFINKKKLIITLKNFL